MTFADYQVRHLCFTWVIALVGLRIMGNVIKILQVERL
jgi:hypothetical protein